MPSVGVSAGVLAAAAILPSLASAGTLSLDTVRKARLAYGTSLLRRDGSIDLEAVNNVTGGGYYSEFEIGSPPQTISFQLDTGSSDTWVNSIDADLCNSETLQLQNGFCQTTFNPEESETYEEINNDFNITYLDGRNIVGLYFEDTVTINGEEVEGQRLGLALDSVRPTGLMGLGYNTNVAASRPYPVIVDNLVSQGIISSPVFSLYLNDLETSSGTILFGGIDTEKYIGELAMLDLVPDTFSGESSITSYTVLIEGFSVTAEGDLSDTASDIPTFNGDAILDSGSTFCLLPDDQATAIQDMFNVVFVRELGPTPLVECVQPGDGIVVDFQFNGKTIQVPGEELIVNAFPESDQEFLLSELSDLYSVFEDWESLCLFGIDSTASYGIPDENWALLGDTFLRSAYVVYDMANEQLGLAQANLNSTDTNIIEFTSDGQVIPDEEGVEQQEDNPGEDNSGDDDSDDTDSGNDSGDSGDSADNDNAGNRLATPFSAAFLMLIGAFALNL